MNPQDIAEDPPFEIGVEQLSAWLDEERDVHLIDVPPPDGDASES